MEQPRLSNVVNSIEEAEESEEESEFLPSFSQPSLSNISNLNSKSESYVSEDRALLSKNDVSILDHKEGDPSTISDMSTPIPGGSRRGSLHIDIDKAEKVIKMCAMACACTFGIGSHFASHIIGPMKGILMEVKLFAFVK